MILYTAIAMAVVLEVKGWFRWWWHGDHATVKRGRRSVNVRVGGRGWDSWKVMGIVGGGGWSLASCRRKGWGPGQAGQAGQGLQCRAGGPLLALSLCLAHATLEADPLRSSISTRGAIRLARGRGAMCEGREGKGLVLCRQQTVCHAIDVI